MTGAAAGIGWADAQALAEMGANVAIWYNTNKKGPSCAAEIEQKASRWGHMYVFNAGDVLYFVFFDDASVMRDFTVVSRR